MSFSSEDILSFVFHSTKNTNINNTKDFVLFFIGPMSIFGKIKERTNEYVIIGTEKYLLSKIKDQKIYNFYTGEIM